MAGRPLLQCTASRSPSGAVDSAPPVSSTRTPPRWSSHQLELRRRSWPTTPRTAPAMARTASRGAWSTSPRHSTPPRRIVAQARATGRVPLGDTRLAVPAAGSPSSAARDSSTTLDVAPVSRTKA